MAEDKGSSSGGGRREVDCRKKFGMGRQVGDASVWEKLRGAEWPRTGIAEEVDDVGYTSNDWIQVMIGGRKFSTG